MNETGEIQTVIMKDDYTKVEISKQDITDSKEIPGAKLIIFDKDGKEVESWVSEEKPHYIERLPVGEYTLREVTAPDGYDVAEDVKFTPVGEYTLREVTAPDGYDVAEDVKFTVAETGEIQHVVMKDAPKKQPETPTTQSNPTNPTTPSTPTTETAKETPTTPKTGDDRNPLIWLLLLGLGGGMAGSVWFEGYSFGKRVSSSLILGITLA